VQANRKGFGVGVDGGIASAFLGVKAGREWSIMSAVELMPSSVERGERVKVDLSEREPQ